ncbi:MAG: hypothetical protein H6620_05840 [Halobacteriovoraceae bacterium]|nr:hypothetical protein [Halobacteriovoraceae bacterium]
MKGFWNLLKAYFKDEDGQTSMEYILLIALAAAIIMKFRGVFKDKMGTLINNVFDNVTTMTDDFDNF